MVKQGYATPDRAELRAEWCIFLTQDLFSTNSLRVYLSYNKAIVSRRKFRATEGNPDSWNYERKTTILPIPRKEKGNASPATRTEDKEEDDRVETVLDKHLEGERLALNNVAMDRMVLRSHTKAMT